MCITSVLSVNLFPVTKPRKGYTQHNQWTLVCFHFQIIDAVYKESKKDNLVYKLDALSCMGEILEIFSLDKFEDVFGIMTPVLEKVSAVYVISETPCHHD